MLLYTDGVTDARNAAGEEFGEARLGNFMTQFNGNGHLSSEKIVEKATSFSGGHFEDDLTVLALSVEEWPTETCYDTCFLE